LADKLVTVIMFQTEEEAYLSKSILEAADIESLVAEETEDPIYAGLINLQVRKRDAKRAREILKEARVMPSEPFKIWDKWMVAMGAGWVLILLGIMLMLFTHINKVIPGIIIIAGVILVAAGFNIYGKDIRKE
jgi:hypothetical protein